MQDKDLIAGALSGDPSAERALYEAHVDRVFRLAYRMAGDQLLAEEFTQDTFVRAFEYLPGFRGQSAFSTWLHAIAMSVILSGLRKLKGRRYWELEPMEKWGAVLAAAAPDRELRISLLQAVDALPEDLRAVFVMHEVEGYKHAEIAAVMDMPVGTAKAKLFRARQNLRAALSERPQGAARLQLRGKEGA